MDISEEAFNRNRGVYFGKKRASKTKGLEVKQGIWEGRKSKVPAKQGRALGGGHYHPV